MSSSRRIPIFTGTACMACESLFTVMGTGCESVKRGTTADGKIEVTGKWEDGRTGIFRQENGQDRKGYGGKAIGEKGRSADRRATTGTMCCSSRS